MYVQPPFTNCENIVVNGAAEKLQILNKTAPFRGLKIVTTR